MVSVHADEDALQPLLAEHPDTTGIAATNGPRSTVLSGDLHHLHQLLSRLPSNIRTRWLQVSHAFHSPLMNPMLDEFRRAIDDIEFHEPRIPIISTTTGEAASGEIATPDHWVEHVRRPVRFAEAVTAVAEKHGTAHFVEAGPDGTLTTLINQVLEGPTTTSLLRPDESESTTVRRAAARLWTSGVALDRRAWIGRGRGAVLPGYPFQHQRYWPVAPTSARAPGEWYYTETWQPHSPEHPPQLRGDWLLLTTATSARIPEITAVLGERGAMTHQLRIDDHDSASSLAEHLRTTNARIPLAGVLIAPPTAETPRRSPCTTTCGEARSPRCKPSRSPPWTGSRCGP